MKMPRFLDLYILGNNDKGVASAEEVRGGRFPAKITNRWVALATLDETVSVYCLAREFCNPAIRNRKCPVAEIPDYLNMHNQSQEGIKLPEDERRINELREIIKSIPEDRIIRRSHCISLAIHALKNVASEIVPEDLEVVNGCIDKLLDLNVPRNEEYDANVAIRLRYSGSDDALDVAKTHYQTDPRVFAAVIR